MSTTHLCNFCLQPFEAGSGVYYEHGPPSKYWNSHILALPMWHPECAEVAHVWIRYRGLMYGIAYGNIKSSWKLRRVLKKLARDFYYKYDSWTKWFIDKYSERKLAAISGRWCPSIPSTHGPYR